ncbi:MAG TPA: hypothetical protein VIM10_05035 [Actinopolymorphaceae bacterium]
MVGSELRIGVEQLPGSDEMACDQVGLASEARELTPGCGVELAPGDLLGNGGTGVEGFTIVGPTVTNRLACAIRRRSAAITRATASST